MVGRSISHYTITEKIGGGGMGVVYKARDDRLKRDVALKFLPPELTRDAQAKERFIHEARAASALDHPNICTVHEIDETDDGQLFIVMSCYDGQSLRHLMQDATLSTERILDLARQLAEGLRAAHAKGIVHRDLKPENVMVTESGTLKILDFGLAKLEGQSVLTVSGSTLGTAAYMSPEQIRGESTDGRSDIFSFFVIFYELLAGRRPFRGDHQLSLMYSITNEDPPALGEINPVISEHLDRIVAKGLRKDPDERYQSVEDVLSELVQENTSTGTRVYESSVAAQKSKDRPGGFLSRIPRSVRIVFGIALALAIAVSLVVLSGVVETNTAARREQARTHLEKGRTDLERGDRVLAEREFSLAVEIDPDYALAWSDLSALNVQAGRIDEAIAQARKAVNLDQANAMFRYNLGYALDEKGDREGAHDEYAQALALDSAFAGAYSALGNLLVRLKRSGEAEVILQAGLANTNDVNVTFRLWKNLGMAQRDLGALNQALSSFRNSIASEPTPVAETRRLLALTLEESGQHQQSLVVWREYLPLEKDETLRQLALQHIAELDK